MTQRSVAGAALAAGSLAFEMAKKWWVLLLRGILLLIIGILSFTNPLVWITFAGVYMLVDGIGLLWAGFGPQPTGQSRWPLLLVGILGIIAGLIVLINPVLGGLSLVWVIGAWAIVTGILEIVSAIALRKEIDNEWWLILTGVLSIIFGILVFQNPLAGAFAIQTIFGAFAVVAGIFSIALAFRVRSFGQQIGAVS
ncbi:MAG: HdeD family acid-resistance protein [Thermomicrobiales bacterium]|nr:HdeD family acid-resistance protein [Thermomicrobiales bacterium]